MNRNAIRPSGGGSRGFTLLELLVVIAIIVILAGLVVSTSGYVMYKAGESRTRGEIEAISAALESYKIDNGTYPEQENGESTESSRVLVETLMPTSATNKVYFEFPRRMLSNPDNAQSSYLVDAFNNPYHYQFPGDPERNGTNFFDLWSTGKKRDEKNTNKWIKNW